jgi:CheY-like chemotaxis protein
MNLAVNARDAMPEGGSLIVSTRNVLISEDEAARHAPMTAGSYVLLSVADTGHGMDEATKTHIFEPFFTTKEVGKGTGLGLATVYGVVKQSGGFVWVESTPGNGATFDVYLPQCQQEASRTEAEAAPAVIPRGSETILVVEDEESVRAITCEFLTSSGYTVLEAANGVEALEVAARHQGRIHLVLSDMVMPKMSGTVLAERLKMILPKTVVILISGYAEYSNASWDSGAKPAAVLQKPLTRASLVEKVKEALEGSAPRQKVVV